MLENTIKEFLKQGRKKLTNDLPGTREAIKMIADDRVKEFIKVMDKGLDKTEREVMSKLIIASMHQAFCYGYGIGKLEGLSKDRVIL